MLPSAHTCHGWSQHRHNTPHITHARPSDAAEDEWHQSHCNLFGHEPRRGGTRLRQLHIRQLQVPIHIARTNSCRHIPTTHTPHTPHLHDNRRRGTLRVAVGIRLPPLIPQDSRTETHHPIPRADTGTHGNRHPESGRRHTGTTGIQPAQRDIDEFRPPKPGIRGEANGRQANRDRQHTATHEPW